MHDARSRGSSLLQGTLARDKAVRETGLKDMFPSGCEGKLGVALERPHGLYRPWNSPGQNTGVGSLSLLQGLFPTQESMSDSLQPHELYIPRNSPGQNTGVGSLSLLQGLFPTQESNPGLLHCEQILYQLSYQGNLECC